MYAGKIVETNGVAGLFARPRHPYTQGLLRGTISVEAFAEELFSVPGAVPDTQPSPSGCASTPAVPWRPASVSRTSRR